ncbi:hypothetical protein K2Z83_23450 [Oscillochloris sp. ZM17-4]|uniref:hypothetical protein n=1 Tax=Oscillochloris sp. ZM17-4 TaxID=2866714 RepID=UPI001C73BC8E|nr:hypothetical protein [Oscillochloris sp. ZM17-4]MBX0330618.1 hypothetical protein [Oscillochloris sp. ZM17-4]
MPGLPWSEQDDQDLRRLYVDPAVTREELEQRFQRSWMAIKSRANSFGLHRRSPRPLSSYAWTEAEEQLLRELYPDLNNSREEIARKLGRTWKAIQHKIHELGISHTRERNNPCQVRRDYFKVIDSEEKAYWLGFIAADGCVYIGGRQHTLSIALQRRDRHWLERFRDIIAPCAKITDNAGPNSSALSIGSQELIHDLITLGITPRKSLTLEWPRVPEPFEMPFLLGYFDGDGSLMQRPGRKAGQYQWHLLGTLSFLTSARDSLLAHTGIELKPPIQAKKKASPNLYLLYAAGQTATIDHALNACGLGLPRKHIALVE